MTKVSETKLRPKGRRRPIIKAGEHAKAAFAAAAQCPLLAHWFGRERGEPFDQARSQVIEYLIGRPEIRQWIFCCFSRSGAIVYNRVALKWHGKETRK